MANVMDAESGPLCDCGRPSEYESGLCGYCVEAFSDEPPGWAKDPWNNDEAAVCSCGRWLESLRPGKHQCGKCDWMDLIRG